MPLSHLLHLCFLNKLRSTKACEAESTVATCSSCWSHRTISPFSSSLASPFADLASSPPPLFSQQTQTGKNFRNLILRPRTNGKKILSLFKTQSMPLSSSYSVLLRNPNHCHMLRLSHPPPTSSLPRTTDCTTHLFKAPSFFHVSYWIPLYLIWFWFVLCDIFGWFNSGFFLLW